jgi:N-acylneuraminate cytidylyltransferase
MRILALIPARGGSKRLPGKNLKHLGGMPLISWSINISRAIPDICDVLVSTDDSSIADIAVQYGALVPWLRPEKLATDDASTVDVALHALDWYESTHGFIDAILVLQPTSPFRSAELIERSIEAFKKFPHSCVSVSELGIPANLLYTIDSNKMTLYQPLTIKDDSVVYRINGAIYLIAPSELRLEKKFINKSTRPIVSYLDSEGLDIDTQSDWELAQEILKRAQDNRP